MTVYAPSDVQSITVPDGCGQPHAAGDLAEGERFAVDCAACEPRILAMAGHGWASDPLQVAPTPDERRRFEALEANAKAQQAATWSNPQAIGNAVAAALGQQGAPSLLEQIKALSAEDRKALVGLLSDEPTKPEPEPKPPAAAKKTAPAAKKTAPGKAE